MTFQTRWFLILLDVLQGPANQPTVEQTIKRKMMSKTTATVTNNSSNSLLIVVVWPDLVLGVALNNYANSRAVLHDKLL